MAHRPFTSLLKHEDVISGKAITNLCKHGYAIIDNAFGSEWGNQIKNDIKHMKSMGKLHLNSTHFINNENKVSLLEKKHIWELSSEELSNRECFDSSTKALNNILSQSQSDLCERLFGGMGDLHCTIKIQYNAGFGGCFPYHFDTAEGVDSRKITAIYYMNEEWKESDGGEILLNPFPFEEVSIEPLFDRLVLFSSSDMLHRVMPSYNHRYCLTFWIYENLNSSSSTSHMSSSSHKFQTRKFTNDESNDEEKAMNVLLSSSVNRRHFNRLAYSQAWRESIIESHNEDDVKLKEALIRHDKEIEIILKSFTIFLNNQNFSGVNGSSIDPLRLVDKYIPIKEEKQPQLVNWFPPLLHRK